MCSDRAGRLMWAHSGVGRSLCLIDFARGQLGRADCQWCRARTLRLSPLSLKGNSRGGRRTQIFGEGTIGCCRTSHYTSSVARSTPTRSTNRKVSWPLLAAGLR